MKQILTQKYKVTIRDKNGVETSQEVTAANNQELQMLLSVLAQEEGHEVVNTEIVGKYVDKVKKAGIEEDSPQVGETVFYDESNNKKATNNITNTFADLNMDFDQTTPVPPNPNPYNQTAPVPHNIQQAKPKEKIIKQGNLRIKLVGDKVFTEDWVKCDNSKYKINYNNNNITKDCTIFKKDWVEMIDEEENNEEE